jgi:hypothetical protein
MTKEQKIRAEICFADKGSGSYLYCSLWDMMDDHEVTMEDFHNRTDAWRKAVVASLCETYEYASYEEVWSLILCSAFVKRDSERETARETAENIKAYLIAKIERYWDKSVKVHPDDYFTLTSSISGGHPHTFNSEGRVRVVELSEMLGRGHELSIRDMDFDSLIVGDEEIFNSEGRIEQGCGKEDCCRT